MSTSYHGWTHLPKSQGGTDPIQMPGAQSYFRAWLYRYSGSPITTSIAGIGITNTTVRYDYWENSNTAIFEPRAFSGFANPPVIDTDAVGSVRCYGRGLYEIQMAMVLNDANYGSHQDWNDGDPMGWPDCGVSAGENETRPGAAVYENIGFIHEHVSTIYPGTDFEASGGDPPPFGEWPANLGNGTAFVTGFVTAGSHNVTGANNNEILYAFLQIVYTPLEVT